jgi:VWFA-related protein
MSLSQAQQPEPTFRVASELVVIDLVAVDRQGRFISDLRPEEIEVKEDGKRQAVELLRLVGQPTASLSATGAPTPSKGDVPAATPPPPSESGQAPGRRLAIVVDTLSLSVDAVPRVRESLLATLDDLPGALPVLIATIGIDLQVIQPFTTDRSALRRAVSALPTQLDPPAGVQHVFDAVDRVCAAAVDGQRVLDTAIEAGERLIIDAQTRSGVVSEALAALADRLGTLEGRKHLVFYSSGHAISPVTQAVGAVSAAVPPCTDRDVMQVRRDASSALGRLSNRSASEGLRIAIDRANRAQVTFYTLDPAGVTTSAIMPSTRGTAQTGGSGPLMAFAGLRGDAGRDYVEGLAVETGGLTIKSNDMAVVFRRAWEDASQYYLVGYPPPASNSKREMRKISVSVKRPGASVRFRRGYIATSSTPPIAPVSDGDRAIEAALADPARFASDDIRVTAMVERQTLAVEVLVPLTAITFSKVDGRHAADFAVHAVLQALAAPPSFMDIPGKDISLRLTPEEYARIASANNLRVVLTAPAPSGDAHLTVVVRDSGGWLGTRQSPVALGAAK